MVNILVQESSKKFCCKKCNYITSRKSQYDRHLLTLRHEKIINDNNLEQKVPNEFICECGKKYNYLSGLSRHRKSCKGEKKEITIIQNEENIDYKSMFLEMINENKELRKTIAEMIPNMGNNNNNTINNKQKFNINVFLNEKCKDAISMDEFIDKIEVSMKNLLTTKEKGQVYGISNIIMENMNKLSLYERPLHCTDKKRETLYVKNNEWEKDDSKEHINKALKKVESKQLKNLNVWLETHPNYMNNSLEQEEFAKLMSECGKSIDDGREKIIKKLCDNVYIEKVD
jgi:hypothetical protein